jgi:adenylyltransferase/sulfurtransferase
VAEAGVVFEIVTHPIDGQALRRDLLDEAAGGLVIFEGLVRNHNEGRAVSALEYEIFASMAHREAERIFAEARARFDVIGLRGAHRSGRLEIGEMAVWVGASARHRQEAFRACRFLIDEIKDRLPVWKKEHYVTGAPEWVDCQGCGHHHEPALAAEQFYGRQLSLPDFGVEGQAQLTSARVLVVGAGGLGCPALSALTGAGVGHLTICDGDRLDVSNLHRQTLYSHEDLGEFKAALAARRLANLNPLVTVTARTEYLTTANAVELVADHDLVLDCSDNFATRFLLHDACFGQHKVLVQAGIYQYEGQLQVFDFRGESTAGCLRCVWPEEPSAGCVGTCADAGVLGAVPAVLGGMQALETIKLLTGRESPSTGATVLVDLLSLRTSHVARPRDPACPLCGEQPRPVPSSCGDEREPWEVGLAEFRQMFPAGRVVDIRENHERTQLSTTEATWDHIASSDADRLLDLDPERDTLLVCHLGVRTFHAVHALRAAGNQRVWSLAGGVESLP